MPGRYSLGCQRNTRQTAMQTTRTFIVTLLSHLNIYEEFSQVNITNQKFSFISLYFLLNSCLFYSEQGKNRKTNDHKFTFSLSKKD